jgi:peptidoglycan-associated lipoprotein
MIRKSCLFACIVSVFAVAGCGNRSTTLPASTSGSEVGSTAGTLGSGSSGASTAPMGESGGSTMTPEEAPEGSLLSQLVVYFDFDRSEIRAEFDGMLAAHARYLANNPNARVRLEGHTDERGSREYNIGLGERRAQAVRQVLLLQGATADQISTVSYGEERPAVLGSDEEAWSQNRRVELVYQH